MTITPFAPRAPYIVVLTASLRTSMEAMSYGLTPDKAPPGPGVIGTPSMTYKGSLSAAHPFAPRMRTVSVPSAVRPSWTPETRSARIFSIGWPLELAMALASTTFGFAGADVPVVASGWVDGARCAQAATAAVTTAKAAMDLEDSGIRFTPSCSRDIDRVAPVPKHNTRSRRARSSNFPQATHR